jgi:hypothetical protein
MEKSKRRRNIMRNKLKELSIEFFENHLNPTEEDLYNFLVDNEWRIYADYEKNTHKEIIIANLEHMGYNTTKMSDKLIDSIVERFGDILYDDNDNHFGNCIRYAIDDYKEDLEEYKLEGCE